MFFFWQSKKERRQLQIRKIAHVGILMAIGAYLFKYIPMKIWGSDILFDASLHMIATFFVLYIVWFFVDQNEKWRIPFFVFAGVLLSIMAYDRIAISAHDATGLLFGVVISLVSIYWVERKNLKNLLDF